MIQGGCYAVLTHYTPLLLVATLKKGMYISLVHPIGQSLAIMLTKDIHEPLQKMLHAGEGMPVCVYDSTKY